MGIKKMDRVPNVQIKEMWEMIKGVDERIDQSFLKWFGQIERIEHDRIAKRIYAREYVSSRLVG